MKKFLILLLIVSCLVIAEERAANDPAEYTGGARSIGMGRTVVAAGTDTQAQFANPASIANVGKNQFGLFAFKLFDEYDYFALSSVWQTPYGNIGISYLSLGVADIPSTYIVQEGTEVRVKSDSVYNMGDRVLGLTYAQMGPRDAGFLQNVDYGATFKLASSYISGSGDDSTLTGFGFDIGTKFDIGLGLLEGYRFGAAIQNVLPPKFTPSEGSASAYAQNMRLGVAKQFKLYDQDFIGAADFDNNGLHFGGEYLLDKSFSVRAGLDDFNMTLGLGLKMFNFYGFDYRPYTFALDYAYHMYPTPLENVHLFSITMLGVTQTKRPTIELVSKEKFVTINLATVQGLSDANAQVSVYVNNKLRKMVKANSSGAWNGQVFLDQGRNNIYAVAQFEQDVESDTSETLTIFSDQVLPEITTDVQRRGETVYFVVQANKLVKAVVVKLPDDQKLALEYSNDNEQWQGSWLIPAEYANKYLTFQTVAVDEQGTKSKVIEDTVSTKFVDYPSDRAVIADKFVTVRGTVQAKVKKITVSGLTVTPDETTGKYSVQVPLDKIGKNVLEVQAIADDITVTSAIRVLHIQGGSDLDTVAWAKKDVSDLMTLGAMELADANTERFNPKGFMTRQELAKALAVLRGLPLSKETGGIAGDVQADSQYAPYIKAVIDAGIMEKEANNFRPTQYVLRREAVVAITKMDGLDTGKVENKSYFDDVQSFMPYAPYISAAVKAGIITPQDNFNPDQELRKADAAVMLSKSKYARQQIQNMYNWQRGFGAEFEKITPAEDKTVPGGTDGATPPTPTPEPSGGIPTSELFDEEGDSQVAFNVTEGADTAKTGEYLSFLKQYESDELLREGKVRRTGDSIVAGGETTFEVTSPVNNFVVTDQLIKVSGQSKSPVKVEGRAIPQENDGKFAFESQLQPGRNQIRLESNNKTYVLSGLRLLNYEDIAGSKEETLIEYLATAGYFQAGQKFYPEQKVTREEYAALLVRMAGEAPPQVFRPPFVDVPQDRWSAPSIQLLKNKQIITGDNFKPDAPIDQAEAAVWYKKLSTAKIQADQGDLTRLAVVKWLIQDKRVKAQLAKLRSQK